MTPLIALAVAAVAAAATAASLLRIARIMHDDRVWMAEMGRQLEDFQCWLDDYRRRREGGPYDGS